MRFVIEVKENGEWVKTDWQISGDIGMAKHMLAEAEGINPDKEYRIRPPRMVKSISVPSNKEESDGNDPDS